MKPGDLVKRHRNLILCDTSTFLRAHEELDIINRQINFVWAFATNRSVRPPVQFVSMPHHEPGLLLDDECKDFKEWVRYSREDPQNRLSIQLVRVLWNGEVVITLRKWIEKIEKSENFRGGEQ